MLNKIIYKYGVLAVSLMIIACTPSIVKKTANKETPSNYYGIEDTTNSSKINWQNFFKDPELIALIDTALKNNQELNIVLQEIEISQNEVRARRGEYLPFVDFNSAAGMDKPGRYTRNGVVEDNLQLEQGKSFPEPFGDLMVGAYARWEIDIWRKLGNARRSAVFNYLSTVEGKNFMVTNLIAEIANSYYELLALDNQLDLVDRNIEIQSNALEIVRLQKQAARVTELAVRRFEAQVFDTKSLRFNIRQKIIETENKINFLLGRFPQPVLRNSDLFNDNLPDSVLVGIPSQLLENRPDIKQAEHQLEAARLDVKVAKAQFYPSLGIRAGVGYQAFNSVYLLKSPESLIYSAAGDLMAPLINRNAIKANYLSASNKQIQAVYNYERTVLNGYIEVLNQLSNIENLARSFYYKDQQVHRLTESIGISNDLFKSARADYMEVLLTQRDALDSKFELIDIKMQQLHAVVNIYQALGGGWR